MTLIKRLDILGKYNDYERAKMFAFLRQNHNYIIRVNVIIVSWKLYKLFVYTLCSSVRNVHDIASLDQIGRNL